MPPSAPAARSPAHPPPTPRSSWGFRVYATSDGVGSGREIDLAVEQGSAKQLKNGAKRAEKVTVNGRSGYCLTYQSTSVVFDVGSGQVLQVTGPCQAGVRFAAVAIPRIPQARR